MANFQIQKSSSTVNWTGKKVLGLHTGSISIAKGYIEVTENQLKGGEVQIDMTSIVITDIGDKKASKAHCRTSQFRTIANVRGTKLLNTLRIQY